MEEGWGSVGSHGVEDDRCGRTLMTSRLAPRLIHSLSPGRSSSGSDTVVFPLTGGQCSKFPLLIGTTGDSVETTTVTVVLRARWNLSILYEDTVENNGDGKKSPSRESEENRSTTQPNYCNM